MNLIILKDILLRYKKKENEKKSFWKPIEKEKNDGNLWKEEKEKPSPELKKLTDCGRIRTKRRRKKEDDFDPTNSSINLIP